MFDAGHILADYLIEAQEALAVRGPHVSNICPPRFSFLP